VVWGERRERDCRIERGQGVNRDQAAGDRDFPIRGGAPRMCGWHAGQAERGVRDPPRQQEQPNRTARQLEEQPAMADKHVGIREQAPGSVHLDAMQALRAAGLM